MTNERIDYSDRGYGRVRFPVIVSYSLADQVGYGTHIKKAFTAQRVFTDRDTPLNAFSNALGTPQTRSDVRVLNFHGVGGQGKTALCEQFTITLAKEKTQNKRLGWATLDFDESEHRATASALLTIRLQLAARGRIPFPAFDTAFARYFAFAHPGHNIRNTHPDLFQQPNNVLQDVEGVIGDIVEEIPGAGLFYKYLKKLSTFTQNWWQRRGKEVLQGLDTLDPYKLLAALPTYLGADLYDWLFDEEAEQAGDTRRLVILLDTYEALWRDQPTKTGLEAMRVDAWVRKLVEETPGILYVLFGRDQLNWAEIEPEWAPDIAPHLLGGLSRQDADKFLQQVPIEEADVRTAIIESAAGLPFYLDLQVDLYENLKQENPRPPASEFGGKKQEILARFSDHLDENTRRALQIVSHARFIDEGLVHQLAETFLGGRASIDFKQLTGYSFWKQQGNSWYLHALMREYLQDRQRNDEPALFNDIHQHLFEVYDSQLEPLEQVIDITETHKQALTEAGYHQQQYAAKQFPGWACRRGPIFHKAYAWEQLEPLWERALEVAESLPDESHLDTAGVLHNLAALNQAQGEPLYQRSLRIREERLGENHPDVANSLNNLAMLYESQGEYAKAEHFYQRSLKILEATLDEEHPNVAASLNNLAALYRFAGEYSKAEPLCQRSLRIREEKLGEDHGYVANTLDNLAMLYVYQAEYAKAEPLCQRSLRIREEKLGEDHPLVAVSLDNLAGLYQDQGEYAKAERFYQRSLKILENTLGDDHPHVGTALNNLAAFYRSQGDYGAAKRLCRRSIEILEASLGEDHLKVADPLNNLAALYQDQGVYDKAEPLYQRSLRIRKERLGEDHPAVANSLNNLAALYRTQGKHAKAEPLCQRAITILEKVFPNGHPNLDTVKSNCADVKRQRSN